MCGNKHCKHKSLAQRSSSPKIIKLGKESSPLLVDSGCYWQSHLAASGKDGRQHAYREELEDFFVPSDETGIEMMWLLSKMLL